MQEAREGLKKTMQSSSPQKLSKAQKKKQRKKQKQLEHEEQDKLDQIPVDEDFIEKIGPADPKNLIIPPQKNLDASKIISKTDLPKTGIAKKDKMSPKK